MNDAKAKAGPARVGAAIAAGLVIVMGSGGRGSSAAAAAAPLQPSNIVVSLLDTGVMREYTTTGTLVQSFTFPDFEGGFHDLRDIVVGPGGNVYAYNGTFTPQMSTLVPATSTITSQAFTGWSTVNNISYGGIATYGTGVFVTDMNTAGASQQGIVRFDTGGGTPVRFGTTQEYQDLTVGGDGELYALVGSTIDVYDPATDAFLRTITLTAPIQNADIRGIAVAGNGNIYLASWGGSVYAATPSGGMINFVATGATDLTDIDINDAGELLVGSRFGDVILMDDSLIGPQTKLTLTGEPTVHVAFATPLTVPEPSGALLAAAAAALLANRRRRRQTQNC